MLHFSAEEYADRLARAEAEMSARGLDGMLVFCPDNLYWLTGYDDGGGSGIERCLVLGGTEPVLLAPPEAIAQARMTSVIEDVRASATPFAHLRDILAECSLTGRRIGIETETRGLTGQAYARLLAALDGRVTLYEASDLFPDLRRVLSETELVYMRRAAELADEAFEAACEIAGAGTSEGEVLAAMQARMLLAGGDLPAMPPLVGSGDHAHLSRPHAGRRVLAARDLLCLEWSGAYRHYLAAMMRSVVIGPVDDRTGRMHDAAVAVLEAAEAELRPGRTMGAVFDAYAKTMDKTGFGDCRLDACGTALGARLAPGQAPGDAIAQGARTTLRAGMTLYLRVVLVDPAQGTSMMLGRSSTLTDGRAQPLSRLALDLVPI